MLVTEKLLMTLGLFPTGMEAPGGSRWWVTLESLCFSITPSLADVITLTLVSVTRGVAPAGFPLESRAVGGNRCHFPAFL